MGVRVPPSAYFSSIQMPTEKRVQRVESVLSQRQSDLVVVLENLRNTHNANAVLRTMDLFGVQHLYIINTMNEPFPINEAITTGADRGLTLHPFFSVKACMEELTQRGFQIYATSLTSDSVPVASMDYCGKRAIVFGNEKLGVSEEILRWTHKNISIPMKGMVRSFNLSVSVALILYEALRQREEKNYQGGLPVEEKEELRRRWLHSASR